MVIRGLKLKNFGKFVEKDIELSDGINIIYGTNEAGKSTIHTFIRGMFFGISKARGRVTKDDLYTRYLPWNSPSLFQGSMDIEVNQKEYRIYRNFQKDNKDYKIVDLTTGRELDINDSNHPLIKGLSEANYRNTISIEQLRASTDKDLVGVVKNYIANLTTTKSSEVNVMNAIEYLGAKRKEIEANNTKDRIAELNSQIKNCEYEEDNIVKINETLALLEERQGILREYIKNKIKLEDEISLTKIKISEWSKTDYFRLEEDIEEYEDLLNKEYILKKQNHSIEHNATSESIEDDKVMEKSNENSANKLNSRLNLGNSRWNEDKPLFLTSLIGTILIVATNPIHHHWLIFMLLLWAVMIGIIFIKQRKQNFNYDDDDFDEEDIEEEGGITEKNGRRGIHSGSIATSDKQSIIVALQQISERKSKLLNYYKVANHDALKKFYQDMIHNKSQQDKLIEHINNLDIKRKEVDQNAIHLADIIFKESKVKDEDLKNQEEKKSLLQKLNYASECDMLRYERLKWELERLEERQNEVYEIKQKISELKEKQQKEEKEIQAIQLSVKTIEEVSIIIHDTFGLKISQMVSDITARITNNRYNEVKIDEKLNIKVLYEDDYIPLERLSVGTIHQIYLALRIAIAKLLFEDQNMPLILDDCFAYYDDKRLIECMKELQRESTNQLIIFTCHKREMRLLDELGMNYHLISL